MDNGWRSPMFKNILVPTDLTEKSRKALEIALAIRAKDSANITLLHVIETIEDSDEEFHDFYEKLRDRAYRAMKKVVGRLNPETCTMHQEVVFGNRVKEIVHYALEKDIDLIVMASHPIDQGEPQAGWATISYRVGILSHCPVMMVK
jgi:nucleotide-binding universal stress UspA family protein